MRTLGRPYVGEGGGSRAGEYCPQLSEMTDMGAHSVRCPNFGHRSCPDCTGLKNDYESRQEQERRPDGLISTVSSSRDHAHISTTTMASNDIKLAVQRDEQSEKEQVICKMCVC